MSARDRALNYAFAVAVIATLVWWISPGRHSAKVLEALITGTEEKS